MAVPLPATPQPIEAPFINPAGIEAAIPDPGVNSENYLGGTVNGTIVVYPDVSDFCWFIALRLPARIRSDYNVTLGRTLIGTPQADVSSGETIPRIVGIAPGEMVPYPTMLRPQTPIAILRAIEDSGGTPSYEQPIGYETRLAALSRMFPPSLYTTVDDALGQPTATAQEVLQFLFDLWADLFPEFQAKPVPPLVLFVPDMDEDSETFGAYNRTLTTDRIYLKQPEDRERSIQTLLEEFRAVFVGYGVGVDSDGDVVIIPPPWAAGIDRTVVAPRAYRLGPGSWTPTVESVGAVGRTNVTSTDWDIETDYDEAQIEVELAIRVQISNLSAGPEDASLTSIYSGTRATVNVVLAPNTPQTIEHSVVSLLSGGNPTLVTVRYEVTWDRPDPTGGTITVVPVNTPTSVGTGLFVGEIEVRLFLAHAVLLTAYSVGVMGVRSLTVPASHVETPVPEPSFDGSRVINRQTARYADVDFVEDTDVLPALSTRIGATNHLPSGTAHVPPSTINLFVDDDDEPLIIGDEIEITFDYQLIQAATSSGGNAVLANFTRSNTFTLRPGQTRSFSYNLNGEVTLTFGHLVTIRFTRTTTIDGRQGLRVDFPRWALRSNNIALIRPWFGHSVAWSTTGAVYGETGEVLEVTYDETSGDADVALSQTLYGIREGPEIDVNFFRVTEQDLIDITEAIVRFNMVPRARYSGIRLTPSAEIVPDDLGSQLLLPWGIAAVLEAYRYQDARAYQTVAATREIDVVLLYPLVGEGGSPAADTDANTVEGSAGIVGATYVIEED